jgi:hypothetical protein
VPTVSVIAPTRNRSAYWQSAWLLDSLRAQTEPPDELVIAVDHTEDDTVQVLTADVTTRPLRFPVVILEVLAPRAEPMPASGIPDNCALHAAAGDIIIHVDDDISLPRDFCRRMRLLFDELPRAVIWSRLSFVDADRNPLPAHIGDDCRDRMADQQKWKRHPGGLIEMPMRTQVHWGAVFTVCARDARNIGGHDLDSCGYHNTDTRLGNRLARSGLTSYVTSTPATTALHLGTTWYAQNKKDRHEIRRSQGATTGPRIANGGADFWNSVWFKTAYRLTSTIRPATM